MYICVINTNVHLGTSFHELPLYMYIAPVLGCSYNNLCVYMYIILILMIGVGVVSVLQVSPLKFPSLLVCCNRGSLQLIFDF